MASIKDFEKARRVARRNVFKVRNWIDKNPDSSELKHLQAQREALERAYSAFSNAQDEIEDLLVPPEQDSEDRCEVEDAYLDLRATLENRMDELLSTKPTSIFSNPDPPKPKPQVKLPEIAIPPFTGDPTAWVSFFELFSVLVGDNQDLSDIQKFLYLKGYLRGEPAKLISNLEVSNANYGIAMDILKKRYSNSNLLLRKLFNDFIDLKEVPPKASAPHLHLRELYVAASTTKRAIENAQADLQTRYDLLCISLLERKLDPATKRQFEFGNDRLSTIPTLDAFLESINTRCVHLENLAPNLQDKPTERPSPKISKSSFHAAAQNTASGPSSSFRSRDRPTSPTFNCIYCSRPDHKIYSCPSFLQLSVSERFAFAKSKNVCVNCLGGYHFRANCASKRTCSTCGQGHHTLLHRQANNSSTAVNHAVNRSVPNPTSSSNRRGSNRNNPTPSMGANQVSPSTSDSQPAVTSAVSAFCADRGQVLLGTIQVFAYSQHGHRVMARALIDSGSQISFATREFIDKIGCPVFQRSISVSAINSAPKSLGDTADFTVHSYTSSARLKLRCVVLDVITTPLPQIEIDVSKLNIPDRYLLADPSFGVSSKIDILIGMEHLPKILRSGFVSLGPQLPMLQETTFGHVVYGPIAQKFLRRKAPVSACAVTVSTNHAVVLHSAISASSNLTDLVQKFHDLESIEADVPLVREDDEAENQFVSSTRRLPDNSFQVSLPLRSDVDPASLGTSFHMAKRRHLSLVNRLSLSPRDFQDYSEVIGEYVDLNHVSRVPISLKNEHGLNSYFLPHFAVIKEGSTSKTRVVFDGSAKSSSGLSLNDLFLTGFPVQDSLAAILLRLRTFAFVFAADIRKMYRQIHVDPAQRYLLNFLWTDPSSGDLICYRHNRLVFGLRPASYLATRVLNVVADEHRLSHPLAYRALRHQTYVDDVLSGSDSEDQLYDLKDQLVSALGSANFLLHKYSSNSARFMGDVCDNSIETRAINVGDAPSKILGLQWSPSQDVFLFSSPSFSIPEPLTKRAVLTIVAQCWDPIGFISPIILVGKLLVQRLWSFSLGWDDPIPDPQFLSDWEKFLTKLPQVSSLRIPRKLSPWSQPRSSELHIFCDASSYAYAAVAYLRTISYNDCVSVTLITSKTRVAPSRSKLTIPRLELSAMVLGSKLLQVLLQSYKEILHISSVHLWTDSQIALYWIRSTPTRWAVFVANRVKFIRDVTASAAWHHVPSDLNAADLASRGTYPASLAADPTWISGPSFLSEIEIDFSQFVGTPPEVEPPEQKVSLVSATCTKVNDFWTSLLGRYSSFATLLKVVAYLKRPFSVFRDSSKSQFKSNQLTPSEIRAAELLIVRQVQEQAFPRVLSALRLGQSNPDPKLVRLNLFLDPVDHVLRVGGRLQNADLPFSRKNPILLPSNHPVVALMLRGQHEAMLHAGPQNTLANFRLKYWPLDALRAVKRIIHCCLRCHRFRAAGSKQIMADLPVDRVSTCRPFSKAAIDYGGPFFVKSSPLRNAKVIKAYIAIFVCLATKAIHIELVSSLSTDDFVLALKRFVARRGNPSCLLSDNATNFLGARNALVELYDLFQTPQFSAGVKSFCLGNQIQFRFLPPRSPHFGGLHEAAIKSCKYHLRRVVGNSQLTFERLYTVLTQIEAILNSRPLSPLSDDPGDFEPLTPAHFLIGEPLTSHPEQDVTSVPENRLKHYRFLSRVRQIFWKRWRTAYFNQLMNRTKWFTAQPNVHIGMLALLREDDVPPLHWPMCRILEVFPGKDHRVRTVKVQTSTGTYVRPVVKVCPLPLLEEDSTH